MFGKLCLCLLLSFFAIKGVNAQSTDSAVRSGTDTIRIADSLAAVTTVEDSLKKANPTGVPIVDSVIGDIKTPVKPKPLSFRSVAIPLGMITVGALMLNSKTLSKANLFVREQLFEDRDNFRYRKFDDYLVLTPAVAAYALNIAGVKGKNNFVDRSIMFGMSQLIANGLVFSTKGLTGVIRPDSSDSHSFPSGHTSAAFVSAEFLRQEYKDVSPWIGVGGYVVATATGFMRMYNNKHWLNDVVAGAGVGILSVRLSYWIYPKIKNFILKKTGSSRVNMVMLPTYENGMPGLGMVASF